MEINDRELRVLSKIMEWYLKSHPRCPATKSELESIKSALNKTKKYQNYLVVRNLSSNLRGDECY